MKTKYIKVKNSMKSISKNPLERVQGGAVAMLLGMVCVVFFVAAGCGMFDNDDAGNGKKVITPDGLELWLGRGCDCKEELYYYSQGEKHYFDDTFLDEWLHIGFYPHVQNAEIVEFIAKTGLFKPVDADKIMRVENRFPGFPEFVEWDLPFHLYYSVIYVNTKVPKTCTQLKDIILAVEESSIIAYANLAFWWEYGIEKAQITSFSPYFDVIVKDRNNLSDLYAVAQETKTTIMERSEHLAFSSGFTLRANKDSKGNALQMANYFVETGKFRHADAQWFIRTYIVLGR